MRTDHSYQRNTYHRRKTHRNDVCVLIDIFVTEKGKTVKVYKYRWFMNCFKTINISLEEYVEILCNQRFEIMKSMFSTVSDDDLRLLKQESY